MINIAQETLGFRRTDFSSVLSLLMPAESLLFRPAVLTVRLQPTTECSPTTLPCVRLDGIRSLIGFGNRVRPLVHSVLYHRQLIRRASPQAISGRTSYHGI